MSATDELRRMLDERGVEWRKPSPEYWVLLGMPEGDSSTIVGELSIEEAIDGTLVICNATPEQAIAATLGGSDVTSAQQDDASTCTLEKVCDGYLYFRAHECNKCGTRFAYRAIKSGKNARPNFCPNCGAKVVDE